MKTKDGAYMEYMTAQDAAEKWGITRRRVQILCSNGRINGAKKIANLWVFRLMLKSQMMQEKIRVLTIKMCANKRKILILRLK